jgi:hypothetical protein
MLAMRNVQIRTAVCSVCGRTARVSPLKSAEGDVICKTCRCQRCSIPISPRACERCGVAHGTPSTKPGLCERCFESTTTSAAHALHNSALSGEHWSAERARAVSGGVAG